MENKNFMVVNSGLLELTRKELAKSCREGSTFNLLRDMMVANDNNRIELESYKNDFEKLVERDDKNLIVSRKSSEIAKKLPNYDNFSADGVSQKELENIIKILSSLAYVSMDWGDYMGTDKTDKLEELAKKLK